MLQAIKVISGISLIGLLGLASMYVLDKPGYGFIAVGEGQTMLTGEMLSYTTKQECESAKERVQKEPDFVKSSSCEKSLFH